MILIGLFYDLHNIGAPSISSNTAHSAGELARIRIGISSVLEATHVQSF